PNISCHNLRHTFCSNLILNGVNVKTVQLLMGHAHAETTLRIYTNITLKHNMDELKTLEGKIRLR
ncbi:MAG: tyrosine-type recombinase/integrase, partial [Oscillospiraceae bacterium]|nr:tyrosine-type recombinase/integrase [Oscillospiraceae bacterium]